MLSIYTRGRARLAPGISREAVGDIEGLLLFSNADELYLWSALGPNALDMHSSVPLHPTVGAMNSDGGDQGSADALEDGISRLSLSSFDPRLSELTQDIITNPELYDRILEHCSPAGLVRFSRVCKDAFNALRSYYRRGFNINKHLSRYFDDPIAFRSLQACTGTLISGSDALQFLDRSIYPDSDLDLYADTTSTLAVGLWVVGAGYTYQSRPDQEPTFDLAYNHMMHIHGDLQFNSRQYDLKSVTEVFTFVKVTEPDQPPLKVQIISATLSPLACILDFHSTCVLNFITYDKAYSLYPRATFEERRTILCSSKLFDEPNGSTENALQKYKNRGWEVLFSLPDADIAHGHDRALEGGFRWADDEHTWIVPLNTNGVQIPPASLSSRYPYSSPNIIIGTNWKIERVVNGVETAELTFGQIRSALLLSTYVIADKSLFDLLESAFHGLRKWTTSGDQLSNLRFDGTFLAICKEYRDRFGTGGLSASRYLGDMTFLI